MCCLNLFFLFSIFLPIIEIFFYILKIACNIQIDSIKKPKLIVEILIVLIGFAPRHKIILLLALSVFPLNLLIEKNRRVFI
jgi:hypothetical protein